MEPGIDFYGCNSRRQTGADSLAGRVVMRAMPLPGAERRRQKDSPLGDAHVALLPASSGLFHLPNDFEACNTDPGNANRWVTRAARERLPKKLAKHALLQVNMRPFSLPLWPALPSTPDGSARPNPQGLNPFLDPVWVTRKGLPGAGKQVPDQGWLLPLRTVLGYPESIWMVTTCRKRITVPMWWLGWWQGRG